MAEQLGVATLLIGVNTRDALATLEAFRKKAEEILSSTNTNAFSGIAKSAEAAGKSAGDKLAKGIKSAVTGLKFDNIEEALNFSGALNGTIADLNTYKKALVDLRDTTKTTTPGFNELNAQIESTSGAIKALSSAADGFTQAIPVDEAAAFIDVMRGWAGVLKENEAEIRATDRALRSAEGSLFSYDKASKDAIRASEAQAAAARELRDAYLGVAGAAVKAAAGAVGTAVNAGKGAVGAAGNIAKGAVKLGKTGYDIGAGVGVFDEPGTGPFGQQIKAVSDRFKFVAEQAKTTRGVLLRVFEGAVGGAGLLEIVKNADLLKSTLNNLGGTAKVAEQGLNGLAGATNIVAKVFNSLEGDWAGLKAPADSLIGNFVNIADGAAQATAGAGSLADTFAQFGVEKLGGAIDTLVSLNNLLGQVPLEAAGVSAAVAAALAVFGGDLQKQAASGIGELLNKITNLGAKALQVRGDLQAFYEGLLKPQLALPSTEMLEPKRKGIQRLQPSTLAERAGEAQQAGLTQQKLEDAFATNLRIGLTLPNAIERGARWFQKQAEYAQRVAEYSKSAADNQLKPALNGESSQIPIPTPYQFQYSALYGPKQDPYKVQQAQMQEDLARVQARREAGPSRRLQVQQEQLDADIARVKERRLAAEKFTTEALQKVRKGIEEEARVQQKIAKEEGKRLADRRADRSRRFKDAIGSALIGGAFPALFGQGLGASVGGGIGGGSGGLLGGQFGFGLSLVGTQLGTAFDTAIQKSKDLAKALESPIENFSSLQESAALSSKALENQIASLISVGRGAEAAALIQEDLTKTYGSFENAKQLASAQDDLNRSWSQLSVTLAGKVAPTITELVERFSRFLGLNPVGQKRDDRASIKQFSDYLNDLEKTKGYGAKLDVSFQRFKTGVTLSDAGGDPGRAEEMAYKKAIEYGQQKYGLTQAQKAQEKELLTLTSDKAAAEKRTVQLRSLAYKTLDAEIQGNQRASLLAKRQTIELERQNKLKELGAITHANRDKATQIELQARMDILKVNGQIAALDRFESLTKLKRVEAIKSLNEQIANEQRRGGLTGSGNAALQASQSYREAVRAQKIAEAASRANPNDAGLLESARQAADAVQLAAAKARTDLVEAFRNARKEAQEAAAALTDAYLNLRQLQTGDNGLNKYLTPQLRAQREQDTFNSLLPLFEKAKADARGILGVPSFDVNFSGKTKDVNQEMINFIKAVENEKKAGRDVNNAQDNYVKALNSQTVATQELGNMLPKVQESASAVVDRLQALVDKTWEISVSVNRDTGAVELSNAYGRYS